MRCRSLWSALVVSVLAVGALPALAQISLVKLPPPPNVQATTGSFTVPWEGPPADGVDQRYLSVAWFYSTKPDGSDKNRITTYLYDNFVNYKVTWQAAGFAFDWDLKDLRKRNGHRFLAGPAGASPLVYSQELPLDSVVGLKVRPAIGKNSWGLQLRVQPQTGASLLFQNDGNRLNISEGGNQLVALTVPGITPGERKWYWYEIGLKARKSKDVEIRIRIYNEERTKMLFSHCNSYKLMTPALCKAGGIALMGPADFEELYVDPWSARWGSDAQNTVKWDTTQVENGDYYLIAEVSDGRDIPQLKATSYRIEVRNRN